MPYGQRKSLRSLSVDCCLLKCYAIKMKVFSFKGKNEKIALALGAESAGNFAVYFKNSLYFSSDFGDLLIDKNFQNYHTALNLFLKKNKIKPDIILTDLHPLYRTTDLGKKLAKKYQAEQLPIQHHLAHIFTTVGESQLASGEKIPTNFFGLACDGTGYGSDGLIWGGEIFYFSTKNSKISKIERIGQLENQTLIGADLAIKEPARILLGLLAKFLSKKEIFVYLKKYYTQNEFEVLYNQLRSKFNTSETSSTGRILDAAALLLGLAGNERKFKHQPTMQLEKNSTAPYTNLRPQIAFDKKEKKYLLLTTPLFVYLLKNLSRDKKRLAATVQSYLARGFFAIINQESKIKKTIYLGGGLSTNKIISFFFTARGAILNKKIPAGDAGLSFGQICYYFYNQK